MKTKNEDTEWSAHDRNEEVTIEAMIDAYRDRLIVMMT